MLVSLELRNFRKHKALDLTFTPGFNLICGANWSGKSSVLLAILYALFGPRALSATTDELVSFDSGEMLVRLQFSLDGKLFEAVRAPKKARLTCLSDEKVLAAGQGPVTEAVEQLLGLSARDFLSFHLTRQEDAFSLISLGPAKLGEYISRVTGVDLVDRVLDSLRDVKEQAAGAVAALQDPTEALIRAEKELKEHGLLLADKQGEEGRTAADLAQHQETFQEKARSALAISKARHAWELAQREKAGLEAGVKQALTALERADGALLKLGQVDEPAVLEGAVEAATAALAHAQKSEAAFALWQQDVAQANKAIEAYRAAISFDPPDLEALEKALEEANSELERAKRVSQQAEHALSTAECSCCGRPFEGADKPQLEKAQNAARLLEQSACREAEDASRRTAEARQQNQMLDAYSQWQERQARLNANAPSAVKEGEVEALGRELTGLQQQLKEAKTAWISLIEKRAAKDSAEQAVLAAKGQLRALEVPPEVTEEEAAAARREETYYERLWQETMFKMQRVQSEAREAKALVEQLEAKCAQLGEEKARITAAKERLEHSKELTKFLRDNRDRFFGSVWEAVLEHASEFVRNATSGDVETLARDTSSGDFVYLEGGRQLKVSGSASGMQKAIFGTALKLALADFFGSRFGVLIFDEVTAAAQDDTSLLFSSLLSKAREQILFVTHRQEDAAVADNVIQLCA